MSAQVAYLLLAIVLLGIIAVAWLTVRYHRYVEHLRSGTGRKPKPVWKPFWID